MVLADNSRGFQHDRCWKGTYICAMLSRVFASLLHMYLGMTFNPITFALSLLLAQLN